MLLIEALSQEVKDIVALMFDDERIDEDLVYNKGYVAGMRRIIEHPEAYGLTRVKKYSGVF